MTETAKAAIEALRTLVLAMYEDMLCIKDRIGLDEELRSWEAASINDQVQWEHDHLRK